MHNSSIKGTLAYHKVCADLLIKGYEVLDTQNESLPYDIVATKNDVFIPIQIKYSTDGRIRNLKRSGTSKRVKYDDGDFKYYAIYNPTKDVCIYPSIKYGGSIIRFEDKRITGPYFDYQDFLDFTDDAKKDLQ